MRLRRVDHDRVSRWVSRRLAHQAGFFWFNVFTVAWFAVPVTLAWTFTDGKAFVTILALVLASYLDVVTWFGGGTQFTLAYQNAKADRDLELALRSLSDLMKLGVEQAKQTDSVVDDLYVVTQTLLKLAEEARRDDADVGKGDVG